MDKMETNQTDEHLSTQKVLSSHHDPGWNDPPKWAAARVQNSSSTPTKRLLSRRTGYPLRPTESASKELSPQISPKPMTMPPPLDPSIHLTTAPHKPMMHPPEASVAENKSDVDVDKCQALDETLANLRIVIDEHVNEKVTTEEITKRLDIMKTVWLEDKLNGFIHAKVLELSKECKLEDLRNKWNIHYLALQEKNVDVADSIHLALVMNYSRLCSPWIAGIRHLISELRTKLQNTKENVPESSQPCLIPVDTKEVN